MQSIDELKDIDTLKDSNDEAVLRIYRNIVNKEKYGLGEGMCSKRHLMFNRVLDSRDCEIRGMVEKYVKIDYMNRHQTGHCTCGGSNSCKTCVAPGGEKGSVLIKNSGDDCDYSWGDITDFINIDQIVSRVVDLIKSDFIDIESHLNDFNNPHKLTKEQLTLGEVDNTSDIDKPISDSTQEALDGKQSTLKSGENIKTINGESLLGPGDIEINLDSDVIIDDSTTLTDKTWSSNKIDFEINEYKGADVTTTKVGGIEEGTNISGYTISELLEEIYSPYKHPSINNIVITDMPRNVETGTVFTGIKEFNFSIDNEDNIKENSLAIYDTTDSNNPLVTNQITHPPIAANIGYIDKDNTWEIEVEDTKGGKVQGNISINYYDMRFYGASGYEISTSSQVRGLPQKNLDNSPKTFTLNTGSINTNFYISLPEIRNLVQVVDLETNANITTQYVMENSIQVNDAGGSPQTYKLYRMKIAVPFNSNHRHEIKIT